MPALTIRVFLRSLTTLFFAMVGLFLPQLSHAALIQSKEFTPYVPVPDEFASAIVVDPSTQKVLYSFKPDKPHVAASLTKLANALAFTKLRSVNNASVRLLSADEVGGGRLRVDVGSTMSVQDVFYSSITASANNCATAMARLSGLTNAAFIKRMNQEAKLAGAASTTFYDASGMNAKNMTTARDMSKIALVAFRDPWIRRAATTMEYSFSVKTPKAKTVAKTIKSTNSLLTDDPDVYVVGGKTGYLEESMYNLVVQMRPFDVNGKPVASKEVLVVVFGAPTKLGQFDSAKRLAQWAWNNHESSTAKLATQRAK